MKMELRFTPTKFKSETDNALKVSGYVNKTEQPSEILGSSKRFIEKIAKGAFTQAIKNAKRDIDFLSEHSKDKILASTKNNSLVLEEDEQGLFMSATIAPTSYGKDSYELIKSGIFKNMSFGFRTIRDSWKRIEADLYERTIEELELFEVSVVKDPAYSQSTISARGFDSVEEVEVPDIEIEEQEERDIPLSVQESRLKLEISKKYEAIQQAESRCRLFPDKESNFKQMIENENKKIAALKSELAEIKGQWEEIKKMKNEHRYGNFEVSQKDKEVRQFNERLNLIAENRDLNMTDFMGSVIPEQVSNVYVEKLEETSRVFSLARKFPTSYGSLKIPRETSTEVGGFVGEGKKLIEGQISLGHVTLNQKRVGAFMQLTNQLINDAALNMADYVPKLLAQRTFKAVEQSILRGTEEDEFSGIVGNTEVNEVDFSLSATDEQLIDKLLEMVLDIHPEYLQNSQFIMSRPFYNRVAKLKDALGHFYIQNGIVNGKPTCTLFGLEVVVTSSLDAGDVVGQVPCILGSMQDGYAVMIKKGFELTQIKDTENALRGSTSFLFDGYMDGVVYNPDAINKLVIKA